MQFMIEIRHIETGLAKTFASMQEIADFLVDKVEAEWEGFRQLGPLPAPTVSEDVPSTPVEPSLEGSAPVTVESGTGADTLVGADGAETAPQAPAYGWVTVGQYEIPVAEFSAVAQLASGMSPDEWAAATQDQRDAWIASLQDSTARGLPDSLSNFPSAQIINASPHDATPEGQVAVQSDAATPAQG